MSRARRADITYALEITWTVIPTIIVVMIYYWGFKGFIHEAVEPPAGYEITAIGRMWNWTFQYPNGYISPELHIPPIFRYAWCCGRKTSFTVCTFPRSGPRRTSCQAGITGSGLSPATPAPTTFTAPPTAA